MAVILTEVPSVRKTSAACSLCTVGAQVEDSEISNWSGCVGGIGNHMPNRKKGDFYDCCSADGWILS